ncbi:hypothetical protein GIW79_28530 [Pseudomonas sp. PA-7-1E]|jgi:hypothetical protein|uniref:DUF3757 domain-containing protein n=1 Tax=Pseudomonas proteolytica TaxID=219574 RepID=A0AAW5A049_9PSED|nr:MULTISPECIES: hypothetical protein [Pseudomonas]MBU0523552.1 hypothetical protein [Gammaproteobacteria bacterium]MBM3113618.1 hypothetical protein [Pseudomonas arcuscaelestis]MBU0844588.1 hypothetical protein [Gammaproteobacteria bacterium]MBU1843641.1 hypothetical protein [Gammaproteobacteria bacterium]MCF5044393.1 hypothetical protein [Pseudomonas sp. PA-7-1E]
MRPLKVVLLCLSTALTSSYITLQLASPATDLPLGTLYLPPKLVIEHAGEAVVWGGWRTRNEHVPHGDVAVEIRCHLQLKLCTEAVAGLLRHEEGEDLEAQTYLLNVSNWAPNKIEAAAVLDDCLIRQVTINPEANTAVLRWSPKPGCQGGTGQADLVGDPV